MIPPFLAETSSVDPITIALLAGNAAEFALIGILVRWLLSLVDGLRADNRVTAENTDLKEALATATAQLRAQDTEIGRLKGDLDDEIRRGRDDARRA